MMAVVTEVSRSAPSQCLRAAKTALPGDELVPMQLAGVLATAYPFHNTLLTEHIFLLRRRRHVKVPLTVCQPTKKGLLTFETLVKCDLALSRVLFACKLVCNGLLGHLSEFLFQSEQLFKFGL